MSGEGFSLSGAGFCIGKRCDGVQGALSSVDVPDRQFCRACHERVEAELRDFPRLYSSLVSVMLPSPQLPFQRITGVRSGSGISLNEEASSGRSELLGFLRSWSALVADECSVRKPASRDCGALTSFLLRHLDWLLAHPAARDFAEEIHSLTTHLRQAAEPGNSQFDIGPCVHPGCDARLSAMQSASSGKYEVNCGSGHAWQASQWLQLYRQLQGA
jgi:hypothetical protein